MSVPLGVPMRQPAPSEPSSSRHGPATLWEKTLAIEWTGPACWLLIMCLVSLFGSVLLAVHHASVLYNFQPALKTLMTPESETLLAGALIGWASGMYVALISGAAKDACKVNLLPLGVSTIANFQLGDNRGAVIKVIFWLGSFYCGFVLKNGNGKHDRLIS